MDHQLTMQMEMNQEKPSYTWTIWTEPEPQELMRGEKSFKWPGEYNSLESVQEEIIFRIQRFFQEYGPAGVSKYLGRLFFLGIDDNEPGPQFFTAWYDRVKAKDDKKYQPKLPKVWEVIDEQNEILNARKNAKKTEREILKFAKEINLKEEQVKAFKAAVEAAHRENRTIVIGASREIHNKLAKYNKND